MIAALAASIALAFAPHSRPVLVISCPIDTHGNAYGCTARVVRNGRSTPPVRVVAPRG